MQQEQGCSLDKSLEELPIPPGLLLNPAEREKKNKQLMIKAEKRLKERGAPDFGAHEGEILNLRTAVDALKNSNNKIVEAVKQMQKRFTENDSLIKKINYTLFAQEKFFVEKYSDYKEQVEGYAETKEFDDMGLIEKQNAVVEVGDTVLMRFKIYEGDNVVDDKTKDLMAYTIGTNELSCEFEMVGMKKGETKLMDVVFKSFPKPELAGKLLKIEIKIENIRIKKK